MLKVYDSPRKAHKQCPSCMKYIHCRSLICLCNHVFGIKKTLDKESITLYNEPAKGRKLCKCGKYIGCRVLECLCGNKEFIKQVSNKQSESMNQNYFGSLVLTPSGECPYKLLSEDKESIYQWCDSIFKNGLKIEKTYTKQALKYWSNQFFNNSNVKNIIDEWSELYGYEKGSRNKHEPEEYDEWEKETLELSCSEE